MTTRKSILTVTLALLTAFLAVTLRGQAPYEHLDLVDAKGNIRKPQDYRDRYQKLTGHSLRDCPVCRRGQMLRIETFSAGSLPRVPPMDTS